MHEDRTQTYNPEIQEEYLTHDASSTFYSHVQTTAQL